MKINLPITNRDFELPEDGFFHIAPLGEFAHSSGVKQVVDLAAVKSMVNRFQEEANQPNFPGMLIDFDHFSHSADQTSAAAGWITELQNRANGLWAKIRWSDLGDAAVKGGRYRLVSPVWNRSDCEDLGDSKVRPLRLDRVALTNDPNLKGLTPLSNRAEEALKNYGTSAGASKGWDTRGRGSKKVKAAAKSREKKVTEKKPTKIAAKSGLKKADNKVVGAIQKAQGKTRADATKAFRKGQAAEQVAKTKSLASGKSAGSGYPALPSPNVGYGSRPLSAHIADAKAAAVSRCGDLAKKFRHSVDSGNWNFNRNTFGPSARTRRASAVNPNK